jgi:hypothetical protein
MVSNSALITLFFVFWRQYGHADESFAAQVIGSNGFLFLFYFFLRDVVTFLRIDFFVLQSHSFELLFFLNLLIPS